MKSNHPVPELLCPAGSEEALHAAVEMCIRDRLQVLRGSAEGLRVRSVYDI